MTAVDALSGQHAVSILCRVLRVNRSTYYKHLRRQPSRRKQENPAICHARKIVACRVGSRIDRFLALDTLRDAVRLRGVSSGVTLHTDRGLQFTSGDFRKAIWGWSSPSPPKGTPTTTLSWSSI